MARQSVPQGHPGIEIDQKKSCRLRRIPARRRGAGIDLDQPPRAGIRRTFFMTSRRRLFVRPCPLCGVAMQASKSREDLADVDTFQCLSCQTVISERRSAPPRENGSS